MKDVIYNEDSTVTLCSGKTKSDFYPNTIGVDYVVNTEVGYEISKADFETINKRSTRANLNRTLNKKGIEMLPEQVRLQPMIIHHWAQMQPTSSHVRCLIHSLGFAMIDIRMIDFKRFVNPDFVLPIEYDVEHVRDSLKMMKSQNNVIHISSKAA